MAGPWEKFQIQAAPQQVPTQQVEQGPWTKFAMPQEEPMLATQPEPAAPTQVPEIDGGLWQRLEKQESGGRQSAVSSKGAIGVAQVMPGTAPEAAALAGLPFDEVMYKTNADYNRKLGQAYLGKQMQTFGDERLALAAYNAGPGRVSETIARIGDPSKGQVDWPTFLDNLPDETKNYVRKIHGPSSRAEGAIADAKEVARVGASAVKGGLGVYPEMLSKGLSSVSDWGSYAAERLGVPSIPGLRDLPAPTDLLKEGVEFLFKPRDYEVPETEEGRAAARIGSSTIAGAMAPGSLLANAGAGFTSGLGAEAGREIGGETGALIGSVAGAVVPAGAAKLGKFVGSPVKTEETLAGMALANVKPDDLVAAQKTMEEARRLGVNLTLEQALPGQTNVRELTDKLARMRVGEPLAAQLRAQPQQIEQASERVIGALPGQVKGTQEVANQTQEAASKALKTLGQERVAVTQPLYQRGGNIPKPAYTGLRQAIKDAGPTDRGKTLTKLYNKLSPIEVVTKADGTTKKVRKPITDAQLIDDILRETEKKMSNKPKDPRAAALIQAQIGEIRDNLSRLSTGYKEGSQAHAQITQDIINPAKQGPLGQVAGRTGYDPSNPASRTNLYGIFDRGEGVLTLQKDLSKAGQQGNDAFADAGTSWFADKVRNAATLEGGQLNPDLAAKIEQGLYGSPSQVKRTNEVLAGIARSKGLEESTLVNGMKTWTKTIAAAAKRPPSTKGQSAAEIEESTKSLFGRMANISLITPFRGAGRAADEWINKNAYSHITKLMQTPEGIDTLRKLAAATPGSKLAENLIAKFNATMATAQTVEEEE